MHQNDIGYVLNASNTCPKPDFISDSHFLRVPVNDSFCEKILPWLDRSVEFIGQQSSSFSYLLGVLRWLTSIRGCFREGQGVQRPRPGPLSGWNLPLGHHRHRLHHEEDGPVIGRSIQVRYGDL